MATAAPAKSAPASRLNELDHPALFEAFSPEDRRQMMQDDSRAWTAVSGILLTIVVLGAIIGFVGMLCSI